MKRNFLGLRDWMLFAALVTVALASVAWIYSDFADRGNRLAPQAQRLPQMQMDDFVALGMDAKGRLKQRLTGKRLVQFAAGYSEIDSLYLTLYDGRQGSWSMQSDSGTVLASGDEVLLSGNVHIWRGAAGDRIDIYTSSLRVFPKSHYAKTSAKVRIDTNTTQSLSRGARFYLNTQKIELPAAVKHIYNGNSGK